MSYAKSANAAFGRIGDEMPADALIEYAGRFGIGSADELTYPLEIESSAAQLSNDLDDLYENNLLRAVTAIGQGELLVTPLNMGLVTLAVLNDGDLPVPYLVESIQRPSGEAVSDLSNRRLVSELMQPETARLVRDMMVTVVEKGSGYKAVVPGLQVGGKTGTAQVGADRLPHAWFTGFAQDEERGVVIVVLIENSGEGSQVAAPIFAQIAQVAMNLPAEPVEEIVPTPIPPEPTQTPTALPTIEVPPTSQPEGTAEPTEEQPAPTPTATALGYPSVPPPDIPRDPDKADITAGSTCIITREGPMGTGEFIWPSQFQALSGTDFKEGHPGIDLSTPEGVPVYASDSGLVIFAGDGDLITATPSSSTTTSTLYGHLSQ
jgi:membrane peptidoglycan carboxypeptidase